MPACALAGMMEEMSTETERAHSGNRAALARLLMAGAVIGAMLALSASFAFGFPAGPATTEEEQPATDTPLEHEQQEQEQSPPVQAEFSAQAGSCLTWDGDEARDIREVPCDEPHLFEVTEVLDVAEDYPGTAAAPELDEWQDIAEERCTQPAEAYLNEGLDPEGKFQVSAIFPNEIDWQAGQRDLHCGLWHPAPGGELQELTGSVAGEDQSDVWDAGTCLALDGKAAGDPIDCAEPHAYEMIGTIDLSEEFESSYPTEDEQMEHLDTECTELADEYSGGMDLEEHDLIVAWDVREEDSWEAGSHRVNCKVGAMLDDESGLAPVSGSIAESSEADTDTDSGQDPEQDSGQDSGEDGTETDDDEQGATDE